MYSLVKDWRSKRNVMFDQTRFSVENYYTDVHQKKEMRHSFGDELLNNLHLLPDPLKKNLADSIITSEVPKQKLTKDFLNLETVEDRFSPPAECEQPESPTMAPFSGISSFFSGVMSVITGAMSQLRPRPPAKYYDCYDESNVSRQGSPPPWHCSSAEDQNKNERAHDLISNAQTDLESDMNTDCKSAASQCEDKLNKVRLLLSAKPVGTPKYRSRRPRKVFVEPGAVEESFEDAFSPEDFVSLSNDPYIEYCSPYQYQSNELLQTDSPKMKTEIAPVHETTEIIKTLPVIESSNKNCISVNSDNLNCESVNECSSVKTENCTLVNNITNCENVKIEEEKKSNNIDKTSDNKLENGNVNSNDIPTETTDNVPVGNVKEELVSSCEDKVSKLKALLQERRRKNTKTITVSSDSAPESVHQTNDKVQKSSQTVPIEKSHDKRFKNPCRRTDKRKKSKLRKHIHDDMLFAHEIHSEDLSSVENSPSMNSLEERFIERCNVPVKSADRHETPAGTPTLSAQTPVTEYFDEISGRFRSTSTTESEDSFQIVFSDSPKTRARLPSDCDSEDSFIVFEDSPDSCYTSNDVFGEESEEESDYTDSDSDMSDSGCVPKLAHNLSRTIGDLTDDSLYEDVKCVDEVDCAVRSVCEEIPSEDILDASEVIEAETKKGLLLTEAKKALRKDQPPKKVQFSPRPPEVRVMRVWTFAARQARRGHWERYALDRDRFKRRIADVDMAVSWVLKPQHRSRVMFQRFMPWWNAQRRKEIAEKKQKKEEEERRLAEEKAKEEERRIEEEKAKEEERLRIEAEKKVSNDAVIENGDDGVTNGIDGQSNNYDAKNTIHSKIDERYNRYKAKCNGGDPALHKLDMICKNVIAKRKSKRLEKIISENLEKKCVINDVDRINEQKDVSNVTNGDTISNINKNNLDTEIDNVDAKKEILQNGIIPNQYENQKSINNDNLIINDLKLGINSETVSGT